MIPFPSAGKLIFWLTFCFIGVAFLSASAQEIPKDAPELQRPGATIKISLPVDSKSAEQIKLSIQRLMESAPPVVQPENRFAIVLEFDTASGKTGRGSELEACQSIARMLTAADVRTVETIAYIPAATSGSGDQQPVTQLSGHAVLIAIAANKIALDKKSALGAAGIDETNIDDLVRTVYRSIANQRSQLSPAIVMAMLESKLELYRVETKDQTDFVNGDQWAEMSQSGLIQQEWKLSDNGLPLYLTSQQFEEFRLPGFVVQSRNELAAKLNLTPHALESNPAFSGEWRAVQVDLPPYINDRELNWVRRSLGAQLTTLNAKAPNLLIFEFDETRGDVDACLAMARYLVDLNPESVQTVAYLRGTVRGPAALVALACDQLIMSSTATLGGHLPLDQTTIDDAEAALSEEALADLTPLVKKLARDKRRDWSLMLSVLNPQLEIKRYRHGRTGQLRLLSAAELKSLDDNDQWNALDGLDATEGLSAVVAENNFVARAVIDDPDQLLAFYQLNGPPETLVATATDRYVEQFAAVLSRPGLSFLLLFGAVFFLSTEMSAPGIGVPGFLSALCFMLFFWSHYLDGSAHWLEILMFLVGVVFIGIELFALPGFGLFGIGGLILIGSSLVLASQNFLIPQNSRQLAELPRSLLPVIGAGLGFFVALYALRKVLPNSPYLKRLLLAPRTARLDTGLDSNIDPEAIVDWSFLSGQKGEAITRLVPSGKARIDGRVYDVITDGRMVDKGQRLIVIEAIGNRVVVRPIEES